VGERPCRNSGTNDDGFNIASSGTNPSPLQAGRRELSRLPDTNPVHSCIADNHPQAPATESARDSTGPSLCESLLKLAEEYTAQANAQENDDTAVWQAGSDDQDTA
jgi:hypothetical protein